ncbi:MAG TPA: c-type cytochrome biogenesis protein CcsB [Ktedonobacterales bacterium]|jgi:cytochrome c-type biogenesis protein CcsB
MAVSLTQDFFYISVFLTAVAVVAYLVYTLSNRHAVLATLADVRARRARGKATVKASVESAGSAAGGGAGTATLVREFEVAVPNVDPDYRAVYWGRIGTGAAWFSVIALLTSLIFRSVVMGYPPWVNMYGYSLSFSCALLFCYLLFERRYHSRALGVFATGVALLSIAFAIYIGAAYNQATTSYNVIPALQDEKILILHVSMAIFAYALFTVAFGCGIIYLVQTQTNRFSWLPSAEAADELGYKAVIIGFPLLALNLILGAYWANYAWGHYWSWDPKETSALVTWLVYAIYLHVRGVRGLRGKWSGWLLVLGFAATLFTYFGVSFIVPGLHSYAGV